MSPAQVTAALARLASTIDRVEAKHTAKAMATVAPMTEAVRRIPRYRLEGAR